MMKLITILSLLLCLSGIAHANNLPQKHRISLTFKCDKQPYIDSSYTNTPPSKKELRKQRRLERKKSRPKRDYIVVDVILTIVGEVLFEILIEEIILGG